MMWPFENKKISNENKNKSVPATQWPASLDLSILFFFLPFDSIIIIALVQLTVSIYSLYCSASDFYSSVRRFLAPKFWPVDFDEPKINTRAAGEYGELNTKQNKTKFVSFSWANSPIVQRIYRHDNIFFFSPKNEPCRVPIAARPLNVFLVCCVTFLIEKVRWSWKKTKQKNA